MHYEPTLRGWGKSITICAAMSTVMSRPVGLRPKRWQVAPPVPAGHHQSFAHLHPVLLQVLYNRGLTHPGRVQAFLEGRYMDKDDPFLMPDMEKAVARIGQAVANDETVFVYGDFDADGVTSTVLLIEALRGLGLPRQKAQPYIPDRVEEGYGLNKEALTLLKEEKGASLVISVDCGIRSVAEVEHANGLGLDMIITDHHSIGGQLPPALAVLNPKRADSAYPETMLAGVGIAYKLAQALHERLPSVPDFDLTSVLDLVAIGTVADIAPLKGENRKLVMQGLDVLNKANRPGVAALAKIASLTAGQMTAESIGFALGPRINAAGRLSHAYKAAKLLAANNMPMARQHAEELNAINKRRQTITAELSELAETLVSPTDPILIVGSEKFEPGVVGLVASRLADKYYRPAIVMEMGEEESRASCRSIEDFNITDALDSVADLLVRYGGHAQAAGFTILNEDIAAFKARLTAYTVEKLADVEQVPSLAIDAEIDLSEVDWALYEVLRQLEPTGCANVTPVFVSRGVQVFNARPVGKGGAHLQLEVGDGLRGYKGIAFRQGAWAGNLPRRIDLAYTIGVNEWRGRRSLQLMVQDIQVSEGG